MCCNLTVAVDLVTLSEWWYVFFENCLDLLEGIQAIQIPFKIGEEEFVNFMFFCTMHCDYVM
jgi:hypothetical protein